MAAFTCLHCKNADGRPVNLVVTTTRHRVGCSTRYRRCPQCKRRRITVEHDRADVETLGSAKPLTLQA